MSSQYTSLEIPKKIPSSPRPAGRFEAFHGHHLATVAGSAARTMARGSPLPVFLWFISMGLNHTWGNLRTYNLQLDITGIYNIYYIYIIERAIAANLQVANYSYIPPKTLDSTNLAHFSGKIMFFLLRAGWQVPYSGWGAEPNTPKHGYKLSPQSWLKTQGELWFMANWGLFFKPTYNCFDLFLYIYIYIIILKLKCYSWIPTLLIDISRDALHRLLPVPGLSRLRLGFQQLLKLLKGGAVGWMGSI